MRVPKRSTYAIAFLAVAPLVAGYLWATPEAAEVTLVLGAPLWSSVVLDPRHDDALTSSWLRALSTRPDGSAVASGPGAAVWRSADAGRSRLTRGLAGGRRTQPRRRAADHRPKRSHVRLQQGWRVDLVDGPPGYDRPAHPHPHDRRGEGDPDFSLTAVHPARKGS